MKASGLGGLLTTMSQTLQNIDPASIATTIDASLIAYKSWLCTSAGGQLHQEPGLLWAESSLVNSVLSTNLPQEELSTAIKRIRDHFALRKQNFQWHVGPASQPTNYRDALLAHGLRHDEDEPGMALDLQTLREDIPLASNLTIRPVTNHELLEQWLRVWLFPVPEESVRQIIAAHASLQIDSASPLQFYLGLLDGKPVATVCLFYDGRVAGIHYVVTLQEVRRQGIGGAMTLMAARQAQTNGYRVAVLTASPFGINIYRRLGFREYCTCSTYEWNWQEKP
ncbi:N-acetyltransferase [Ktedonosporobacter rubrisoli]|uniref:N-acetyltransferase n=1 Tax=Ktedonosporobacter rubrisoli TaxID=2509675 RepID=A0A4P6JNY4_KTERU|nr:GNAT family N-acetyltransferase [Ktedonosporobacter rubrisoli]QBD76893.1 N-acetyltransferase [Ktedonosporobacter rubrisoli]